jgi:DNA-binding NarL/FixJ family response regulator
VSIGILVADDFAQWRGFVSSTVQREANWHIVGEASEGPEAVQKAKDLNPDLILLDIGLPKVNGIEVARQIRELVPKSKILFLSGWDDPDIVREALRIGANGYIAKSDAQSELTKAIEAVLRGEQYLGRTAKGRIPEDTEDSHTSNGPVPNEKFESLPMPDLPCQAEMNRRHEVQFYSNDSLLLGRLTHFVGAALMTGNAAIVIATKRHRDELSRELKGQGVDFDAVIQRGAFVSLDAAEVLSTLMVNRRPDPTRFLETFGKLIASVSKAATAEHPRVAVFGEGVALLWAEGNAEGAIQLEKLGNDVAKIHKVDILCAYPFTLHIQEDAHAFKAVCAEHSAVYVG